ncbi:Tim44 domain-containing protein [Mesorhizobium sp. UC74_2]|uniref:Tim44 domain-containing protein n=1 Tax=Mesorhizobium sp. UC74_2 TaxID=3350171 RepID=UPI00366E7CE0
MISGKTRSFALLATLLMAFTLVSTDFADARRGGSFGSRGTRTFQSAPPTRTAPAPTAPVERSMTPNTGPTATTRQQQPGMAQQQRPGLFSGLGGGLMRGILIGGLLGVLFGYGFGGMAGALGFIVQLLLVGLVVMLALRFFRSRQAPATATASGPAAGGPGEMFGRMANRDAVEDERPAGNGRAGSFGIPGFGTQAAPASQDIELGKEDLDRFERMLDEVQTAFAKEDHAGLRRLSTPEMVSYFSEELADNAQNGLRNDVADVHLVQADIAEAWREDNQDYATAAFRYESIDVMRDRKTGKVVEGDERLSETTELWTFTRPHGDDWKLSAIQEASA